MHIRLLPVEDGSSRRRGRGPSIGGLGSFELVHLDRLHLEVPGEGLSPRIEASATALGKAAGGVAGISVRGNDAAPGSSPAPGSGSVLGSDTSRREAQGQADLAGRDRVPGAVRLQRGETDGEF